MNFLRRLLRRDKPQGGAHHALVMVLLGTEAPLDGAAVLNHLVARWDDIPSLGDRETRDEAAMAAIAGGVLGLASVPMPVPSGDLEGPIALAWHWPEAATIVPAHRSHVIVHVGSSTLGAIEVRLLATKLAASVLAVSDGVGVYVGDSMLVRSASDYLNDAAHASRHNLPLLSWIGFNAVGEDGRLSAYTTGLTAFGFLELEVQGSTLSTPEVFGTVADIANYQLGTGKVLHDGDTFGATEAERIRVRYRPSAFIPDTTVAVVELP